MNKGIRKNDKKRQEIALDTLEKMDKAGFKFFDGTVYAMIEQFNYNIQEYENDEEIKKKVNKLKSNFNELEQGKFYRRLYLDQIRAEEY